MTRHRTAGRLSSCQRSDVATSTSAWLAGAAPDGSCQVINPQSWSMREWDLLGRHYLMVARNHLRDTDDAEEAATRAIIKLLRRSEPITVLTSPRAYFNRVIMNAVLTVLRKRRSRADLTDDGELPEVPAPPALDPIEVAQFQGAVEAYFSTGGKRRVDIIKLLLEGDDAATIVEKIGTTRNTIYVELSKWRAACRPFMPSPIAKG